MIITGLNIQAPWANLLISGSKTVETRSYHLPLKYIGVPLALIETPGKTGRFKSRIIGFITFNESFRYKDKNQWMNDYNRHLVDQYDENYGWKYYKDKYGWVIDRAERFEKPIAAPKRKGIIFTTHCKIGKFIYAR